MSKRTKKLYTDFVNDFQIDPPSKEDLELEKERLELHIKYDGNDNKQDYHKFLNHQNDKFKTDRHKSNRRSAYFDAFFKSEE